MDSYIAYPGNLTLLYQYTEAVVTHKKCRVLDQYKCDIKDGEKLQDVYKLLQNIQDSGFKPILRLTCHFNRVKPLPTVSQSTSQSASQTPIRLPRQTATQRQLNNLGEVVESESATGNTGLKVSKRWACTSSQCKNKGGLC
jgi:hypothetical protein